MQLAPGNPAERSGTCATLRLAEASQNFDHETGFLWRRRWLRLQLHITRADNGSWASPLLACGAICLTVRTLGDQLLWKEDWRGVHCSRAVADLAYLVAAVASPQTLRKEYCCSGVQSLSPADRRAGRKRNLPLGP